MNREDLGKVLSLSCVENYFLGYFQERFDVRPLYAESFVPFREVMTAFLNEGVSYENYPLVRLQETSEKLGLTEHRYSEKFHYQKNKLNLIRVNREFFNRSKLLPWRADHYIAIEKVKDGYAYWNNYPLSEGRMSENRTNEIYDGAYLIFQEKGEFSEHKYRELCALQYARIANQSVDEVRITEEKLVNLRDALLVLKVLRKRITAWLAFEADNKRFDGDLSFQIHTEKLIQLYERILVEIQLQIVRKKSDIGKINEKLLQLCEQERLWGKAIQMRRG